jgi:sensor histidine kinase YesM
MKLNVEWIRSLSFRSLRLRLMAYLLLVGSVPLICALLVFYQQSTKFAKSEYEAYIKQNHVYVVQQMQASLKQIETEAATINQDHQLQETMRLGTGSFTQSKRDILDVLDRHIAAAERGDIPVSELCFTFFESAISVCRDTTILLTDPPLDASSARIETISLQDGSIHLRYVAPLFELGSREMKGYMVFLIHSTQLLKPANYMLPVIEHGIMNSNGALVINYATQPSSVQLPQVDADSAFIRTTDSGVVSGQPFQAYSNQWLSFIRWENQAYTELQRSFAKIAILFVLLMIVLSVTIAILFTRGVARPLETLRGLMKRAELGDLKAYWTSGTTKDIDVLGESYNQMLNRLEDLIKQVKVEESLKKEKEFEALQYQLNPHFLYNTLNTIKWVAKIHKTPQISEAVSALVRLLQSSLGKMGDFISLQDEVGLVRDYMAIQTFRYGDEIQLNLEIESIAGLCLVPKLILQPLVENAIIHGLDYKSDKDKQITIKAWIDRDLLLCQVEDNGKGMDSDLLLSEQNGRREGVKEKMSGIGLKHIREKIKLYYGPDYKMLIFSKPNQGTTIRLSLPIHRSEES